ncbi:MAG: dihydrofolate reductase family protein [Acidimicrobiia bacterium]
MEISLSLDGYAAGPDVSPESPMGRGGERLHDWMFAGKSPAEYKTFETNHFSSIGAVILGRRMADLGIGPWGEEPTFHAPCFVVTHRPAETIVKQGGTSYTFVTDGIQAALHRAQEAAGVQDVLVNGGANVARQFLNAGLLDEVHLHLVPVVMGAGTRLFDGVREDVDLMPREARNSLQATHLTYDVELATGDDPR